MKPFPYAIWPHEAGFAKALSPLHEVHPETGKSLFARRADHLVSRGLLKPFTLTRRDPATGQSVTSSHSHVMIDGRPIMQTELHGVTIPLYGTSGKAASINEANRKKVPILPYLGENGVGELAYKLKSPHGGTPKFSPEGQPLGGQSHAEEDNFWGMDPVKNHVTGITNFLLRETPGDTSATPKLVDTQTPGGDFWAPHRFGGSGHLHLSTSNPEHHEMIQQIMGQQRAGLGGAGIDSSHFPGAGVVKNVMAGSPGAFDRYRTAIGGMISRIGHKVAAGASKASQPAAPSAGGWLSGNGASPSGKQRLG